MNVYIEENAAQYRWCVHMDQWHVDFKTPDEAVQFAERLTSRLNAPHSLAMLAGCSPLGHLPSMNAQNANNSISSHERCMKKA